MNGKKKTISTEVSPLSLTTVTFQALQCIQQAPLWHLLPLIKMCLPLVMETLHTQVV